MVLNERFAEAEGGPVDTEAGQAHPMFERAVSAGQHLRVRFESTAGERPQGLVVKNAGGELEVDGDRAPEFALWREGAPEVVDVSVVGDGELRVWNTWRHEDGLVDEWSGNAGMLIEDGGDTVRLRMSDGPGEPSFDDLVVSLELPA